jgi:dTDP-4-amino-4,6-dideoxygalactose transaminase
MTAIGLTDFEAMHADLGLELESATRRVVRSGRFILGPEVEAFERELAQALGVPHAVGVSSGTDALVALLLALDVGPGDEVITTPFSFFATVEAIVRVGARPVFADIDPATLNLEPTAAAACVGERTAAALVVHLFGRVADVAALAQACAGAGVPLLEDAAQAIGAAGRDGQAPGRIGAAAALSFFPSKNLGGFGDSGAVLTADPALAARVRALRSHGASRPHWHDEIGGNYRMDELQAALLRVKLPRLSAWTARRRAVAALYAAAWKDLPLGLPPPDPGAVWNQFVVRVRDGGREALASHLRREGIATAIYYPVPLHLQPALSGFGGRRGQLPEAERAASEVLALPIHPSLAPADCERICETVRSFFVGAGR